MKAGQECGIILTGGFKFQTGDIIIQFVDKWVEPTKEEVFPDK